MPGEYRRGNKGARAIAPDGRRQRCHPPGGIIRMMYPPLAPMTRRDFFRHAALGLGAIAVADLLRRDGRLLAAPPGAPATLGPPLPHHTAVARRVIHIYLGGGLSHVDSFDYKPELEKFHGQEMPASFGKADPFFGK